MVRHTNLHSFQSGLRDDPMRADMEAAGDSDQAPTAVAERDPLTGGFADADGDDVAAATARLEAQFAEADADLPPPAEHEYDVDDRGEVRDWRTIGPGRAATDEAAPYEPKTHTITDDDDQRFSGGGAVDDQISRLIPTDGAFLNDAHKSAPELANLAEKLIEEHGFFEDLVNCRIDYAWERKGTNSKGKRSIGQIKRVSGVWRRYCKFQFVLTLSADTARLAQFTDRQVEAALFHQLCHVSQDAKGNWIRVGHDFEGFGTEVRHYGPWTEDLKIGSQAFTTAVQLGLDLDANDESNEDEDDEDEVDDEHDLSDLPTADELAGAEGLDDD